MDDSKIIKTIHNYRVRKNLAGILAFSMPVVLLALAVVVGNLPGLQGKKSGGELFIIAVVLSIVIIIIGNKYADKMRKQLKLFIGKHVNEEIIAERIDITEYDPTGGFDDKFLRSLGVLPGFDKSYGSDYIKGSYMGKEITYCDVELESEYQSEYNTSDRDGNSTTEHMTKHVTVFKGPVISIVLGKPHGDKCMRISEGRTKICFDGDRVNIAIHNDSDTFELEKTIRGKKQLEAGRQKMREDLNKVLSVVDETLKRQTV